MSRSERIDDLLRAALAELLLHELKDPRVKLATISDVRASRDTSHAIVRVSVLGSEGEREKCVRALQHAKGFLRSQLATRLRLRTVPELTFELDRSAEHSQRISDLLEDLHDTEPGT